MVICTPGRLMDHLNSTKNFTLQHVRYLVLDEVDRLLSQSYLDWLTKLLDALNSPGPRRNIDEQTIPGPRDFCTPDACSIRLSPDVSYDEMLSLAIPLQKLLFSATLTRNPEKLAYLHLVNPVFFSVKAESRYVTPETLQEYMIVCETDVKPLIILHLMLTRRMTSTLCFTSSLETTHRLYRLLQLYDEDFSVAEYSSSLSHEERQEILDRFRRSSIHLLICSDAMARGMDFQSVQHVISYDMPSHIRTYVHRVGRTARAGQQGTAFTLLHPDEVVSFKMMFEKTSKKSMDILSIDPHDLESYWEKYEHSLHSLRSIIELEKRGSSTSIVHSHQAMRNSIRSDKTSSTSLSSSSLSSSQVWNLLRHQLATTYPFSR